MFKMFTIKFTFYVNMCIFNKVQFKNFFILILILFLIFIFVAFNLKSVALIMVVVLKLSWEF